MRRLPWFLAVLLGVTAWGSSPGAAAVAGDRVQTVDVVAVPTAPHARIDYLTGRLLHTADRRVIQLPWPRRYQDSLELLGRGPDGWIVAYHHTATIFEVARDGSAHLLFHYTQDGGYEGGANLTLSTNHELIAIRAADPGDAAHYTVYDLAGFVVDTHRFVFGWLVAFRGRSLYFPQRVGLDRTKLVRWTMGHDPVDTGLRDVRLLDLVNGQFLAEAGSVDRLAGVLQPSLVRWSLCTDCGGQDLSSRTFSPDGTGLAYFHGSSTRPAVQGATIRATSDGHVVTDLRFNAKVWAERWEDSRHLLVEVIRLHPGQSPYEASKAVLRCDLSGRCVRVTTWQHHFILDYAPPGGL